MPKKSRCCICRKPVFSPKSIYCLSCSHFSARMSDALLSPEIREELWDYVRRHGKVCFYTKIPLDLFDHKSPWFLVFDHWLPQDPRKIVITCALVNAMKSDMTQGEFWYYVSQLFNYKFRHLKIRKKKLAYWYRLHPPPIVPPMLPLTIKTAEGQKCCICGRPVFSPASIYCARCHNFSARMSNERFSPEIRRQLWDYVRRHGFVCYYTKMPLDTTNHRNPWYLVFDHHKPGHSGKIVLTSALFNTMKTDLTEKEFWHFIRQLYNYRTKGIKIRKKKLVYWYRLHPPTLVSD